MLINTDCKFYLAYKPCKFHKEDGRLCEDCKNYDPVGIRILIVKLDALGDVLRTTSILPAIKQKYPNSEITWITKKNALLLLESNPFIDRKLALENNFVQYLLAEQFDIGICLDADPQSASILTIANCKEQIGFVCNANGKVVPANHAANEWWLMGINDNLKKANRKSYQDQIYKICDLNYKAAKPQFILNKNDIEFSNEFKNNYKLLNFRKIIGINTGGGTRWQYKKWIFEHYIELIKIIKHNHPDYGILLFGGPEEKDINKKIIEQYSDLVIDTGCDNSVREFAALIDLCHIFFTSDSLGMHFSVALDKQTIVLVGPTSPWELELYGQGEIIYNEKLTCISCYKSTCDFEINCMNTLSPELVYNKMEKYFNQKL